MNFNAFKNHDYCNLEIPNEENKILKYNHGESLSKFLLSFMLTKSVYLKE